MQFIYIYGIIAKAFMGETKMRIAIISAMSSEIEAVIDILDKTEKKKIGEKVRQIISDKIKENAAEV